MYFFLYNQNAISFFIINPKNMVKKKKEFILIQKENFQNEIHFHVIHFIIFYFISTFLFIFFNFFYYNFLFQFCFLVFRIFLFQNQEKNFVCTQVYQIIYFIVHIITFFKETIQKILKFSSDVPLFHILQPQKS